jgi:Ca2+:H+ antiporter
MVDMTVLKWTSHALGTPPASALPRPRLSFTGMVFPLIGLFGGLFGGLLGIGGGSAIAPLLLVTGRLRPAQVAGTTLATVLLISAVGSAAYASLGGFNLGLIWPIAAGTIAGSTLGALSSKRLSTRVMLVMFLVILPYFALKEFFPGIHAPSIGAGVIPLAMLGLGTGFLSGLLGISGASLIVPSLVAFFLIDHHAAQGVAISVALADSLAGGITHARVGHVDYRAVAYMAGPAIVAALAGALLSNALPADALRVIFGVFLTVMSLVLLARLSQSFLRRVPAPAASSGSGAAGATPIGVKPVAAARTTSRPGGPANPRATANFQLRGLVSWQLFWNAMLLFVPLAIVGHWLGAGPIFVFVCSALACVPLSYRLGQATESMGTRVGPVAGGLLNATFGNAAELIISVIALNHGLFVLVRTSLIGSIIGQLLLVLGTSLLLAGLRYRELKFSKSLVQVNFGLLFIALVAIGIPTLLIASDSGSAQEGGAPLFAVLSIMLIIVYGFAVVFSLSRQPAEDSEADGPTWTPTKSLVILGASTGGILLISELLVSSVVPFIETTGVSQIFIGLMLIPIFSNVVDHMVAISVAMKNKMDLSITVSVGSAVQVACLVLPTVVLISYAMGHAGGLVFEPAEIAVLAAGLFLMVPVILDGESNWLEGIELLATYAIIGAILWVM